MEIKVKDLGVLESKGVQELERELLEKHEQQLNQDKPIDPAPIVIDTPAPIDPPANNQEDELSEEKVLSFIEKRYNKRINSFEDLIAERQQEELPEDVSAYLKYKKETGRGIDDFLKLREDYDSMDANDLLKNYFKQTQKGLDEEEIEYMLEDYQYDEDLDDESTVKKTKIARKKIIAEAKSFFDSQKEKYKLPLESSPAAIPNEEKEEFEAYKRYMANASTTEEEAERKRQWFSKKTDEVFSNEFKGFEFKIDDQTVRFSPGDANELKKAQSSPMNFVNKYLDENGLIKDAAGYHRALAVAMNPERFAKFFYEQGRSAATDDVTRKIKNIDMSERRMPEVTSKEGFQVKAVNPDSGKSLKIRSIKKI